MNDYLIKGKNILLKLTEKSNGKDSMAGWYYHIYCLIPFVLVGDCELHPNVTNLQGEIGGNIGCEIKPQYQGIGFAKEAVYLLLKLAQAKNIENIMLVCRSQNMASNKVIINNGGILKCIKDDKFYYSVDLERGNKNDRYQTYKRK